MAGLEFLWVSYMGFLLTQATAGMEGLGVVGFLGY